MENQRSLAFGLRPLAFGLGPLAEGPRPKAQGRRPKAEGRRPAHSRKNDHETATSCFVDRIVARLRPWVAARHRGLRARTWAVVDLPAAAQPLRGGAALAGRLERRRHSGTR